LQEVMLENASKSNLKIPLREKSYALHLRRVKNRICLTVEHYGVKAQITFKATRSVIPIDE
jgi:hypothetical protein